MEAGEPNAPAATSKGDEPRADTPPSAGLLLTSTWHTMLRVTTAVATVATVLGVLVLPGAHGTASDEAVSRVETVAGALGYSSLFLLFALMFGGAYEISRSVRIGAATRVITVGISGLVIALAVPATLAQLRHPAAAIALIFACALLIMVAAFTAVRAAHTRAIGAMLLLYSFGSMSRAAAWAVARTAGSEGSMSLYGVSRLFSTVTTCFELIALVVALAWIAVRGKTRGAALAGAAVVISIALTWFAYWRDATTSFWQAVLDLSLTKVSDLPAPYLLSDIVPLLAMASVLVAASAVLQKRALSTIGSTIALALLARGRFDVPIEAMMATVAAEWALVASSDSRTMWSALIADRPPNPPKPPKPAAPAAPKEKSDDPA